MWVVKERGKKGETIQSRVKEPTNSLNIWNQVRNQTGATVVDRQGLSPLCQSFPLIVLVIITINYKGV